jgi:hypothetical protein
MLRQRPWQITSSDSRSIGSLLGQAKSLDNYVGWGKDLLLEAQGRDRNDEKALMHEILVSQLQIVSKRGLSQ